jgi:hypothetical protein
MGIDHYVRYRVEPTHYLYIAHALTRAVRDIAGYEYSSQLSSAWVSVCKWVTEQMCAGTYFAMQTPAPTDAEAHAVQPTVSVPDPRRPPKNSRRTPNHRNSGVRPVRNS